MQRDEVWEACALRGGAGPSRACSRPSSSAPASSLPAWRRQSARCAFMFPTLKGFQGHAVYLWRGTGKYQIYLTRCQMFLPFYLY